jgi:hypothetical protein
MTLAKKIKLEIIIPLGKKPEGNTVNVKMMIIITRNQLFKSCEFSIISDSAPSSDIEPGWSTK